MTDLAAAVAHRDKPALPQQWAEEIALATSAPTTASTDPSATPPETLGGTVFDVQLDGFLDRFQQEIVAARALKDDFDRLPSDDSAYAAKKAHFKLKMDHIRALFATEGEDFVASLERRNPTLSMAACGQNTLEFVQGIDRLESAVREEEARRAQTSNVHTPPSQVLPTAAAASPHAQPVVNRPLSTPPAQVMPLPYTPMSAAAAAGSPPTRPGLPTRLSVTAGMRTTRDPYAALRASPDRVVAPPVPPSGIGHALYNMSSDETLQLMQSDINALKLELMRMQRAKNGAPATFAPPVPYSLPSRGSGLAAHPAANMHANHLAPMSADGSFSLSSMSPDKENQNPAASQPGNTAAPGTPTTMSTATGNADTVARQAAGVPRKPSSTSVVSSAGLPASILANNNVNVVRVSGRATNSPPLYVSHLELMKSRLEALEKKPFSRRAKSAARLGRTHTMGSMYDHVPASTAFSTGRHHKTTPGSAPDVDAESGFPAMLTPPRGGRRGKHRSLSTPQSGIASPVRAHVHVQQAPSPPQSESFSPGSIASPPRVRLSTQRPPLSPSPPPPPAKAANSRKMSQQQLIIAAGGAGPGNSPTSTPSPNRGNCRNSGPSPAKLFFDAPEEMLSRPQSHAAARDIQRYSLKVARRLLPGGGGNSGSQQPQAQVAPPPGAQEPRAKSAVAVSPSRQRALDAEKMGRTMGQQHTLSDMGMGTGAAAATNVVAGGSTSILGAGGPPSTIETTGSGGRVVEEIEGDMWVRKGMVWKRWRRRYASIVSHQFFGKVMCLFSYDSAGGIINTRSQIVVLSQSMCRALRDKVEIGGAERYMFALRTSSKEYLFAAESDDVRRNWIRELRDAAKLENNGRPSQPTKGRSMAFRRKG